MKLIHHNLKSFFALLLISGFINIPFATHAEDGLSQASQQEVSDADLKTFAEAYTEVTQIYNVYENRITKSKEQEQAMALQQEANQKMNQAVKDKGLSIEDYNSIYKQIENNPSLQQQFTQVLTETP